MVKKDSELNFISFLNIYFDYDFIIRYQFEWYHDEFHWKKTHWRTECLLQVSSFHIFLIFNWKGLIGFLWRNRASCCWFWISFFINFISSTSFFKLNITSWNRLLQTTSETFFSSSKQEIKKTKSSSYSSQWTVQLIYHFSLSFLKWNRKFNIIKKPFFNMIKFLCWKYFIMIKIYFFFISKREKSYF